MLSSTVCVYVLTSAMSRGRLCTIRLIEMQALTVELLERFELGLPKEEYEILRVPAGLMIPLVRGKMELGSVMPLHVSLAQ